MWAAMAAMTLAVVPGQAMAAPEPDWAAVDRYVAEYAAEAGYPGVAVAITEGDRIAHLGAHGTTTSAPRPIASVSKAFTALAVMQQVEAGTLALDTPVVSYLPEFRLADPRGGGITVRHLLNQTSGITDTTLPEKSLPQPDSLAGAVERARQATLASDPGVEYHYTNTNFHLAARLVEVASGEPFGDYLRRHVFEPAGMRSTTTITRTPRDLPPDAADGHVYAYGLSLPASEPDRFVAGSDGVIATAEDMARWLVVQRTGGGLVSAGSLALMHSPARDNYAMGWETDSHGWVRHSGIWFTATAGALMLPDGHGIAVMADSGVALGNEGTAQLEDGIAAILGGRTPPEPSSMRLVIDLALGALTLAGLALGIRGVLRARRWATRMAGRPWWGLVVRLAPRLVPVVVLVTLPYLLGRVVGGGRDLTFEQVAYYSPALVVWFAALALAQVAVIAARSVALVRLSPGRARPAGTPAFARGPGS
ncbi:serine hydrolase [Amycolatopsis deserti]|uniref:Serine hydrolase n=1 Tax=Amycolatopsis deserti TaxID=185696 RepID=A0ABQ3JDS0_9PSEU|nr:serine hydrolase domain-containing protein [Amycolatopsis deserti]GHF15585.1 serine hydrolase [Amycolatopsis deserti]